MNSYGGYVHIFVVGGLVTLVANSVQRGVLSIFVRDVNWWSGCISSGARTHLSLQPITLLSFDLQRNYYIKNVVLFEENSILLLPECLESSGW